ncbi:MAG: hypothetical protein SRB2_02852 [Desulfobacteraceae bacterium Eth-SRB2]|nr:MAG: hypothetical protein SRB2_02852 [Desulfobacteraceae bacterium Eth-SRB2]
MRLIEWESPGLSANRNSKDAQIRLLIAYMRLLRYAAKLALAYIKYPDHRRNKLDGYPSNSSCL